MIRRRGARWVVSAFAPDFLDRLSLRDQPATASEAETSGPWRVEERSRNRYAVVQEGEDRPQAVFIEPELALLAAALFPSMGRPPRFVITDERGRDGFPIEALRGEKGLETIGWLESFQLAYLAALHSGDHLVRSPASMALVMEAAGESALRRAGGILAERLAPDAGGPAAAEMLASVLGLEEVTPELREELERLRERFGTPREAQP